MFPAASIASAHPGRMATMSSLPAMSSPSSSANSDALAVHPDYRSSDASQDGIALIRIEALGEGQLSASQAVRREWSVGCPILRSQTNASALATSKARRLEFSCIVRGKLLVAD